MTYYIRVLYNIIEGYLHNKQNQNINETRWFSRARLSDIDMFMHMNNASYFRVAEYARWAWTYESVLGRIMKERNVYPLVTLVSARYRRPIRLWQKYEIRSRMIDINDKAMHIQQNFYVGKSNSFAASILLKVPLLRKSDNTTINVREIYSEYFDDQSQIPTAQPGTADYEALQTFFSLESFLLGKAGSQQNDKAGQSSSNSNTKSQDSKIE
ncbi:MAG: hypothetical protein EZS28_018177 [Streblomastix strix]|uniref:Thioesterase n=1 Tax=Streblomastix strix TaxID=222440 RepID=A0A5J4VVV2_9EUKA|nr:MAG: hypothetical protein EZS28_018177 [Streblomastix strix]